MTFDEVTVSRGVIIIIIIIIKNVKIRVTLS